jgi:transcription antitermination factor NusB
MRKRSRAREDVIKILYSADIGREDLADCSSRYWENTKADPVVKDFAETLLSGIGSKMSYLDSVISRFADNWQMQRMATIDRNVLRMACYEILFLEEIPPKVSINEAIEIAKKYGDKDSGKFVNGILDKVNKERENIKEGTVPGDDE